jgi:hypothetical protein
MASLVARITIISIYSTFVAFNTWIKVVQHLKTYILCAYGKVVVY